MKPASKRSGSAAAVIPDQNEEPSVKYFADVTNHISDGIVCIDNEWRYTYLNDAALQTHPLGRAGTLGKNIWDIHPQMKGTIFWDKYHEAMETKKVVELESHYAPMDTWFFAKVYPSADGLTILFMDISSRKRAEMNVIQSQISQHAILENTNDSIWYVDDQYRLLYGNTQFKNYIKLNSGREIQLGDNIEKFIPKENTLLITMCKRGMKGEKFTYERHRFYDNQEHTEEYSFNPILNSEKVVCGVSIYVRDITEKRKAEWEYRQSELRYKSVVEQLSEAIFVTNDKGDFIEANTSAYNLLGYTHDELLTKNARDLLYSKAEVSSLEDSHSYFGHQQSDASENQLKRKDGSPVDVELNSSILPDGNLVSIARDITERKKALETLDTREKRFRAMIENSNDIIALLDKNFKPLYRSPSAERITGYTIDDSIINAGFKQIHPQDNIAVHQQMNIVMSSPGKPIAVEFRERHKLGHYIWLEGTVTNMFHDGHVNALVVNLRDITIPKAARQQLRTNESRFRALIENISDGIVLYDAKFNVLFQSASVERILGYTLEERQSRNVRSIVHPENQHQFAQLHKVLEENPGEARPFEYRFLHKTGHYIWLEGVVRNLLDEPGINAFVANYRDISERKEAEESSNHERILLRTLVDNLPDYIYVKDIELRYQVNNRAQLELMGIAGEEETIGKTDCEIYGSLFRGKYNLDDNEILKTGIAVFDREEIIITQPGEERFFLSTKVPLLNDFGEFIGLIGIRRDITNQKRTELELRQSNFFLESAQRAGKIGYWISDLNDKGTLTWSKETCHIFGVDENDFNHRLETFYEIIHPDDREAVRAAASYAVQHRRPYSIDHRIMLRDGTQKWVHEQGEVSFDDDGKTSRMVGIVGDITEHKKAEQEILMLNAELEQRVKIRTQQLQDANKEMEAFSYSISHDLRAPLRIINGYSQILFEDYAPKLDEKGKKTLGVITNNATKMGKLIDNLLEFSKLGRTTIRKESVSMLEVVTEVLSDLKLGDVAIPENIFIGPLGIAKCDSNLIKLVWMNLISNAIKYSGSGTKQPCIEIGSQEQDGRIVHYIKDNGAGFDMNYYDKLFGVFQRLHHQRDFSGIGVGLAIVQRIVVRHGGKVWAEAKVNEGATFFFTIP
ncbi:MAG: PAS domain S-box protein [Chryseolinea sp.]